MSLTSEGTDTSSIYSTDDYIEEHGTTQFIEENEEIKQKLQDFTRDMQKLTDDSNNNTIIIEKEETTHNNNKIAIEGEKTTQNNNIIISEKEEIKHDNNTFSLEKEEATHNNNTIITEKKETTIEETAKDIPSVEISFADDSGNEENKTRDEDGKSIKFDHTKNDAEDANESGIGTCESTPNSTKTDYPYADDDVDDDSTRLELCASESDGAPEEIYIETKFLQIHGSKDDVTKEVVASEENDVPIASSTPVPKLRKTKPSKEVLLGNGIHQ